MPTLAAARSHGHSPVDHRLADSLARETRAEVWFDPATRGRYATDASIYQIEPVGVIAPRTDADVAAALEIARTHGVSLLARGGGTSQAGQTVGRSLVVDYSKHMARLLSVDPEQRTCRVEPGIVLDELNRQLRRHGLVFPVDVSTSARATIGGMTANNSCGTRSLRYGIMRDNVREIEARLADGTTATFGELAPGAAIPGDGAAGRLMRDLVAFGARHADRIDRAFPGVQRRVGGYLIDALAPSNRPMNLATLLCGSEGTLALTREVELQLWPLAKNKALGICHFTTFRKAMEAAQHIVRLQPVAVELVDRTLIELARDIAMFRPVMEAHVRGKPDALLLVEFAEDDQGENLRRLDRLEELLGDLGSPGAVVKIAAPAEQAAVWSVRAAGLNIMMSMKSDGKPVSFIEDCAVPLEHLADYTERLTEVFARHGTTGTWYAHASVGCLHVRPVLNLKLEKDAATMRAIAEEAFAMVRAYKGSHSGEHGDGLVRSSFHEAMYGRETVDLFEQIKDRFDPAGLLNPGKIVRAPEMSERALFRYKPDYRVPEMRAALDWSSYSGAGGGLQGAIEMCNNNGECRKLVGGAMCPSYRATRDEKDVTRGRANTLRLAISGQLEGVGAGEAGLASPEVQEALSLCLSCKACRRECPTGVDMAKLKIEALAAAARVRSPAFGERLVAYLPHYAPWAARLAPLMNLRNAFPGLARLAERATGIAAERPLPRWQRRPFRLGEPVGTGERGEVALFADTFATYFDPAMLEAAVRVVSRLGYRVSVPVADEASDGHVRLQYASALRRGRRHIDRPLCCGRTFLSQGLVEEARVEARRSLAVLAPLAERGVPIVGLEPSCLLTLRDEWLAMGLGAEAERVAANAFLLEEWIAREAGARRITRPIGRLEGKALLHGHCHQKAFDAMGAVGKTLGLIEGLEVTPVESSCCGMAGSFGYAEATYAVSKAVGELSLLPAVRAAAPDVHVVADGFSCRHQIVDGTGRQARHVVHLLAAAMGNPAGVA
jgi:FAD/FMN-containing dehydrogenase/Fe-S oxidoreductase